MLNFSNTQNLTLDERKTILERAVNSQPFFELLDFELVTGAEKTGQYKAKFQVDKDFFITQVAGNFNRAFYETSSEFLLTIATAYKGESIHKFLQGDYLPSAFQAYDARHNLTVPNQKYCDLQDEILPYHVAKNNAVLATIRNISDKLQPAQAKVVLGGYFAIENAYLNDRAMQGVNESLANEPIFELSKIQVTKEGIENHSFKNDRFTRLVLGFGVVDLPATDSGQNIAPSAIIPNIAESTVLISDSTRGLKLNNIPIAIENLAPRLTALRDTHIYYLPTEYLFEPFAALRFETNTLLNGGNGYEIVMLTRTV